MKDNFSAQAEIYAKYRPRYPQEMIDYIIGLVSQRERAWDCATGNGQAAVMIHQKFQRVDATDISSSQLANAEQSDNIFYSIQEAEQTNFPDNHFDLVTVAQALHWFNFTQFYDEIKRVGKNGTIVAAWCYSLSEIDEETDRLTRDFHFNTLGEYWDEERKYVVDGYRSIPFPFTRLKTPDFYIRYEWTLEELSNYFETWSAVQKYKKANGYSPVPDLVSSLKQSWKSGTRHVRFPLHLLVGKLEK